MSSLAITQSAWLKGTSNGGWGNAIKDVSSWKCIFLTNLWALTDLPSGFRNVQAMEKGSFSSEMLRVDVFLGGTRTRAGQIPRNSTICTDGQSQVASTYLIWVSILKFECVGLNQNRTQFTTDHLFRIDESSTWRKLTRSITEVSISWIEEHCRREDLESWFYMLVDFCNAALPWKTATDLNEVGSFASQFPVERSRLIIKWALYQDTIKLMQCVQIGRIKEACRNGPQQFEMMRGVPPEMFEVSGMEKTHLLLAGKSDQLCGFPMSTKFIRLNSLTHKICVSSISLDMCRG